MISAETVEPSFLGPSNITPDPPSYPLQLEPDFINSTSSEETQSAVALVRQLEDKLSRLEQELALLRDQLDMSTSSNESGPTEASGCSHNKLEHERLSSSEEVTEQYLTRASSSSEVVLPDRKRRKYVRKPQADPNAPVKPLTGYAAFANDIRKEYTGQGLSFAETATRIGMDWQVMSQELRELYMSNAANEKARYDIRLLEYRKTESYTAYQKNMEKKSKKVEATDENVENKKKDSLKFTLQKDHDNAN